MIYPSIRIEGSILSPDILEKLDDAIGQRSADFGLETSVKVKDEIARAWADAQDYWRIYQRKLETIKEDSPATTETRNLWIVPLLGLLGYQLEFEAKSIELNGKLYPISHRVTNRGNSAIHIIGSRESAGLDRKPEKAALKMSAHAMMQEYLNLTEQLYSIVTNGRLLRLLRDSSRLVKLTYLEFDLDRIFNDGLFADFAVLYRLLHVTRLPQFTGTSASSLLERYHQETIEQGSRIREGLRIAVTEALQALGTGFLSHPDNHALRQQVDSGEMRPDTYFNLVLRLVYRLLFLMVIEERNLVFPKGAPAKSISIYTVYYSVHRLRRLANTRGLQIARYHDAWLQLIATFHLFENPAGAAVLGTTAMGGQLFSPSSLGPLPTCKLSNSALFTSLEKLCFFTQPRNGQRMPVNFGALATEEFGSVYESLLELHPVIETYPMPFFGFRQAAGNERKTSGSYYTPSSLVDCLLDTALDPLLVEAEKADVPEQAILALKVCDPACGSGHFLIAAAQRIARRLARQRAGDEEPSPELLRHAHREVISHCIYGVDINPMSVELCKVGLWLEAVEPGKPLTFLDHHIKCGNSLLGATPAVIKDGIPDKAFEPIVGDNKEAAKWMKKLNQKDRTGQARFDFDAEPWERLGNLPAAIARLEQLDDDTPESLAAKEEHYRQLVENSAYDNARLLHDAWCAAFVWPKICTDYGTELTTEHLRKIEHNPYSIKPHLKEEIRRLARQYRFFHWHLEFPMVFGTDGKGGFDCVLGNPPWEKLQTEELQFFAIRNPEIASLKGAKRKAAIGALKETNPTLAAEWNSQCRIDAGTISFIRQSGTYPLTGIGKFNTFALFAELSNRVLSPTGRVGCIVPSGIATDDTTKLFFQHIAISNTLVSLLDFENRQGLFPAVDSRMKFCLLTLAGSGVPVKEGAEYIFFAHSVDDLKDDQKRFTLSSDDIELLNPNTLTCATFRSRRDASITKAIYRQIPIFLCEKQLDQNAYQPQVWRLLNTTDDSKKFIEFNPECRDEQVPVVEAKTIHQFDHRFATFPKTGGDEADACEIPSAAKASADAESIARYYITEELFRERMPVLLRDKDWFLTARNITNATNERTVIAAIIPRAASCEVTPYIEISDGARVSAFLAGVLNSFVLDYVARQKVGGTHLSYFILYQLPIIFPGKNLSTQQQFIAARVLELSYTAWNLQGFAKDCGYDGPPFRWDEGRRFQLRCELDAAYFHLYGIQRDDVDYIMETFPIVKRKDDAQFGHYRTKETILKIYDELGRMSAVNVAGVIADNEAVAVYRTHCDPEPGPPVGVNGNFISMYQWDRDNWPVHLHQPDPDWDDSLLAAWFDVCQGLGTYIQDDQIFPRAGREAFVYALIPYLVNEKPGEKFEFYRDAALLASLPATLDRLFLDNNLSAEFLKQKDNIAWLSFPSEQHIDPRRIREALQEKQILQITPASGVTEVNRKITLPPLPIELMPLVPLILKAGGNLDKMQRSALEAAEAAKLSLTQDEIGNQLKALSAA